MSRLAHLVTQLAASPQTQEKLAATYFDEPPLRPAAPRPPSLPPRNALLKRRIQGLVGVLGLLLLLVWWMAPWRTGSSAATIQPVLTFDDEQSRHGLGHTFGLWWGAPETAGQTLRLAFDPITRVGTMGESLRVDFASGSAAAPLGLWFALPSLERLTPDYVEFMIRGDATAGFPSQAVLELRSRDIAEQRTIAITADWSLVRVLLPKHLGPDQRPLRWQECRLLLTGDRPNDAGRVHLDQVRLIGRELPH